MLHRLSFAVATLLCCIQPLHAQESDRIKLGVADSLMKDLSPQKQKFVDGELTDMVSDFTGLKCVLFKIATPLKLAQKIDEGEWHFGLFHGAEFAWAHAEHPKLKPLMIAVYKNPTMHALVVTKKDGKASSLADLKGKDVNLIAQSKVHCRLFADKIAGGDAGKFFRKVVPVENGETVFDDVLTGKVEAAIVDQASLETYQEIHPGRAARLKALAKSETFPSPAIVYREGKVSPSVLEKFRSGMIKANESDRGRETMANFLVSRFEPVPADYPQMLADILKAYPAPAKD